MKSNCLVFPRGDRHTSLDLLRVWKAGGHKHSVFSGDFLDFCKHGVALFGLLEGRRTFFFDPRGFWKAREHSHLFVLIRFRLSAKRVCGCRRGTRRSVLRSLCISIQEKREISAGQAWHYVWPFCFGRILPEEEKAIWYK
jgi:hypothetical protein